MTTLLPERVCVEVHRPIALTKPRTAAQSAATSPSKVSNVGESISSPGGQERRHAGSARTALINLCNAAT